MSGPNQTPQPSYARGDTKAPPMGNFTIPTSTGKEGKKRARTSNAVTSGSQMNAMGESSRGIGPGGAKVSNFLLVWD
jgi:paired amphipathic helix protein Sin3a